MRERLDIVSPRQLRRPFKKIFGNCSYPYAAARQMGMREFFFSGLKERARNKAVGHSVIVVLSTHVPLMNCPPSLPTSALPFADEFKIVIFLKKSFSISPVSDEEGDFLIYPQEKACLYEAARIINSFGQATELSKLQPFLVIVDAKF
ncbi:MAG: hypothetical protein Q8R24_02805 [Legionellaceae bacterium]|nr:hypothetical protein [Legionellaceae bacterium]